MGTKGFWVLSCAGWHLVNAPLHLQEGWREAASQGRETYIEGESERGLTAAGTPTGNLPVPRTDDGRWRARY